MLSYKDANCTHRHDHLLECIRKGANREAQSLLKQLESRRGLYKSTESAMIQYSVKCGNITMVNYFIDQGYNADTQDEHGITLLMLAVNEKKPATVKVLLNNDADIHLTDFSGVSSLQHAFQNCVENLSNPFNLTQNKHFIILEILFKHINTNFFMDKDSVTQSLLNASDTVKLAVIVFGCMELAEILFENGYPIDFQEAKTGYTALHGAIIFGRIKRVKMLIKNGANIYTLDKAAMRPISLYVWNLECVDKKSKVLQSLLKHDSNSVNKYKAKDLECLFERGKKRTVAVVLKSGIDILPMRFNENQSFLHLLVSNENDDVLDALDESHFQFDVDARTNCGETALMMAASIIRLTKVEFLLSHETNVSLTKSDYYRALCSTIFRFTTNSIQEDRDAAIIAETLLQRADNAQFVYEDKIYLIILSYFSKRFSTKVILAHLALDEMLDAGYLAKVSSRNRILDYPSLKVQFDLCTRQLEEMKTMKVCGTVTLFQLLTEKQDKIMNYARNPEFVLAFEDNVKNKSCDMYTVILQLKLKNAMDKMKQNEEAASKIEAITGLCCDVCRIIVYRIISYLSFQDLKSLSKV